VPFGAGRGAPLLDLAGLIERPDHQATPPPRTAGRLIQFAQFSGGEVNFNANFLGGTVYFNDARFSGSQMFFRFAQFSGGEVDFRRAVGLSCLPEFPWTDAPPPGVKLPRNKGQSQA